MEIRENGQKKYLYINVKESDKFLDLHQNVFGSSLTHTSALPHILW